ncbi:MAG: hypothetical protein NTX03_02735 [Bacteroidetes bacterium]|nr:hypothetical protein [Bacteroidota bacterium]
MRDILKYSFLFLFLMLLQVFVFNKIFVLQIASPIIFFYIILVMPRMPHWIFLPLAFLIGIILDSFAYTPGVFTAPCVLLAYIRNPLLRFLKKMSDDEIANMHTSFLGIAPFLTYISIMSVIFHLYLSLLAAFTFSNFSYTLTRIFLNTLLSIFFIFLLDVIFFYRRTAGKSPQS